MDFLFKNDTHVSFPDKNLRNFSLSLREQKPGRRHDNDNEKFHQKSQLPKNFSLKILSSKVRPNKTTTLDFFLKWFTYLGSNLVSALAGLNVNDFPHLE